MDKKPDEKPDPVSLPDAHEYANDYGLPEFDVPAPPAQVGQGASHVVEDELALALDWSAYRDAGFGDPYADIPKRGGLFASAIAVCINSGQCQRETARGVMCPSYRVRKEPAFSPGGRSRLLKKMLNRQISVEEQKTLDEAMAACVACKGCKRECDSYLDMAAIKVEYLAQRARDVPPRLRERLFAALPVLLRHPRLMRVLFALRNRVPGGAQLGQRLLGIEASRALPLPAASDVFSALYPADPARTNGIRVVLLVDSFSRSFAPAAVSAAITVLTRAGYAVLVEGAESSDDLCCGRTWYSQGRIDTAREKATALMKVLQPHIDAGIGVIGLEPSCLLMLRDEYPQLGFPALPVGSALLFEEFVAREAQAGRFELPFKSAESAAPMLVHGHCHEKAIGATKSMRKALKLIPGICFEQIEASCCGGAGSFAFETEHARDSRNMAALGLLPALAEKPDATLIANGFSCRQQVQALDGRVAMHVAEVMARYL